MEVKKVMKKYLWLLASIVCCFISACSFRNDVTEKELNESDIYQSENKAVIDSGKYYRIYKTNITEVNYDIYNSKGEVILSQTTDRPLEIDMINDEIIDISIGMGTGLVIHKYYSVKQELFSEEFSYVVANLNDLVAYIGFSQEGGFENRRVIVQNIFDKNLFFEEYQLNFSNVDIPVIQATFSEDGSALQLIYLSGKEKVQVSEVLNLK